jgi:mannose-6-phosphate isomerase-like protein (cupin superfamily)
MVRALRHLSCAGVVLGACAAWASGTAPAAPVQHMASVDVARAVAADTSGGSGARFATVARDADFSVIAVERSAPGRAEMHDRDTDVWYVTAGSATIVTGGQLVEPSVTGPGEHRAASIRNGREQRIAEGDVVTIRRGIPHWVKSVDGTLRYLTVKVRR